MYDSLFSKHEAKYAAAVMYDTWGHLDAKPGMVYKCSFYIATDCREFTVFNLKCELPGGPAFYADTNSFVYSKLLEGNKPKPEGVYFFSGTYQMKKKHNPKSETIGYFKGTISKVKLVPK